MLRFLRRMIAKPAFPCMGGSVMYCASIANEDSSDLEEKGTNGRKELLSTMDIPSKKYSLGCTRACDHEQQADNKSQLSPLPAEVVKLRSRAMELRKQWNSIARESGMSLQFAWPVYQPNREEVHAIRSRLQEKQCKHHSTLSAEGSVQTLDLVSRDCLQLMFNLATAQAFGGEDPATGFATYKTLGEMGHTDSMVATSKCLAAGIGGAEDKEASVQWMLKAANLGNAQGKFMLADCLLETVGPEPSEAEQVAQVEALSLLVSSAELGHAGAHEYLSWLLDGNFNENVKKLKEE